LFGLLGGAVVAAYLSLVVELERAYRDGDERR